MKSENTLNQLLETSSEVGSPSADVLLAARNVVNAEAQATALRAAKIVHLRRRHRRLTIGVAAAAVAGLVAVPLLSQGNGDKASTAATRATHPTPVVQEHFTTVAQVINAAASHTTSVDPTAAPYWKVVQSFDCSGVPDAHGNARPQGSTCETTSWMGNGRPSVYVNANGVAMQFPPSTFTIGGETLTWREVNARTWTDAQIAAVVADNGPDGKDGRAPSSTYVFKNSVGLVTTSEASATIKRQLWRQLAAIPGIKLDGRAADSLGRTGWKLTLNTPGWGSQWILIDPANGLGLAEGGTGVDPNGPGWNQTIVSQEPASTAPNAPTMAELGDQWRAKARACGLISATPSASTLRPVEGSTRGHVTKRVKDCMQSGSQPLSLAPLGD